MQEHYRVRVRRGDLEVEVESSDKEYVSAKLQQYLASTPLARSTDGALFATPLGREAERPISLLEFAKRVAPAKKTEIAATIAYFLEFHAEPTQEEWKSEDISSKFTDVRKAKPANITDLLAKSSFFMDGREKGSYRLSESGVQWIEREIKKDVV